MHIGVRASASPWSAGEAAKHHFLHDNLQLMLVWYCYKL